MLGWIKNFQDGTQEVGADNVTNRGLVSWSKGRLTGITSVEIWEKDCMAVIEGISNYWQSDDFEVQMMNNRSIPRRVIRRIQKQIIPSDAFINCSCIKNRYSFNFVSYNNITQYHADVIPVPLGSKWFTVELDCKTGKVIYRFDESRI